VLRFHHRALTPTTLAAIYFALPFRPDIAPIATMFCPFISRADVAPIAAAVQLLPGRTVAMVHGFLARLKAKEGDVLNQVRSNPAFQAPLCKTALIGALISALI